MPYINEFAINKLQNTDFKYISIMCMFNANIMAYEADGTIMLNDDLK